MEVSYNMKKAVQFGAGNIGRGFIGAVLAEAGYRVVFADVVKDTIDRINADRAYTVHIKDTAEETLKIDDVSAVNSNSDEAIEEISKADLVTTAVGVRVLPFIAPAIANGIRLRKSSGNGAPMNVIACENAVRATSTLKEEVLKHLDEEEKAWCGEHVGFADCSVDRIVPPVHCENPIDVSVEKFFEWNVEKSSLKGELPEIDGLHLVDNLLAYIERKLFTLNTGHAITAYIGHHAGYRTIGESIADKAIEEAVRGAMQESGMVLVHRFGFDKETHFKYIEKILKRFHNPYLTDEVTRVGRDPLRKLSANDRLISPLKGTAEYGLPHGMLLKGIAAALHYDFQEDPQCAEMQKMIAEKGIGEAVACITGLAEDNPLTAEIISAYNS